MSNSGFNKPVEPTGTSRLCQRAFAALWRPVPAAHRQRSAMNSTVAIFLLCLLGATSCTPSSPSSASFFATFDPATTLTRLGRQEDVSYSDGAWGVGSSTKGLITPTVVGEKHWTFTFEGTHEQLASQLERFRVEAERQLSASGVRISGRGTWSGDFSGFSFGYSSNGRRGFIRVMAASLENKRQAVEIFLYED